MFCATVSLNNMEGRDVVAKLLLLAQDPQNQTIIARDEGCMTGLVASVVHIDSEIVMVSARTLQFLSGHPQNKKSMREFPNLVENLLQAHASTKNEKTKQFCCDTLENLGVCMTESSESAGKEFLDTWTDENATPNKARVTYSKFNIYVDNLDDNANCILAQRILINIPGVISVSLDKLRSVAAIGTREDDIDGLKKKLMDGLRNAGLNGRLKPRTLIVNEVDDECMENSPDKSMVSNKSFQDEDSGYIDESDYYGEKESAVTRWGPSSLEARLEQERREEELRAAQTGRILSKVSSALSSVSSWLGGW